MKDETQKSQNKPKSKSQKLVLIGDSNVGKTSIIDQFIDSKFGDTKPSIGALHKLKSIKLSNGEEVQLDIWDTAGQEKFKSIVPMYYKGSKGIIIVFDITSNDSLDGAKRWIGDIEASYNSATLMLVGNKSDLGDLRSVSTENAQSFASSKNMLYMECSAKSNINIDEVFKAIAEKLPKSTENANTNKLVASNSLKEKESGYCCN